MRTDYNPETRKPTTLDVQIGKRIAALRHEHGWSQSNLGDALGVTFQQVQKYEKGLNRVSPSRIAAIAKAFKTDVAYVINGSALVRDANRSTLAERLIAHHFGHQLADAFLRIEDRDLQKEIVTFVEQIAKSPKARGRPRA